MRAETRLWRLLWIKDLWLFAATTWAPGQTTADFSEAGNSGTGDGHCGTDTGPRFWTAFRLAAPRRQ
eukprot:4392345-Prorocentrum_lima.AAC.1